MKHIGQIIWFLLQMNCKNIAETSCKEQSNTMHECCMDPNLNKNIYFYAEFMRELEKCDYWLAIECN